MFRLAKIFFLSLLTSSLALADESIKTAESATSDSQEIQTIITPLFEVANKTAAGKLQLEVRKQTSTKLAQSGFVVNREYLIKNTTTYTDSAGAVSKFEEIIYTAIYDSADSSEGFKEEDYKRPYFNLITTLLANYKNCEKQCELISAEIKDVNFGMSQVRNRGSSSSAGGR